MGNRYQPRKTQNIRPEANLWGAHDRIGFYGYNDKLPVRCFSCNNLFSQDFFDEGRCPNCKLNISRKELQRDIYIEAQQIQTQGGWTIEVLEDLKKCNYPAVWSKHTRQTRPIDGVSVKLAAIMIQHQRAIKALREQSNVSRILKGGAL